MIIARLTNPVKELIPRSDTWAGRSRCQTLATRSTSQQGGRKEASRSRHALSCRAPPIGAPSPVFSTLSSSPSTPVHPLLALWATGHQETGHLGGHGASRVLDGVYLLSHNARDEALVAAHPPRYASRVRERRPPQVHLASRGETCSAERGTLSARSRPRPSFSPRSQPSLY